MGSCEGHHGHLGAVSGSCLEILPREGASQTEEGLLEGEGAFCGLGLGGGRGKTATCYFVVLWKCFGVPD